MNESNSIKHLLFVELFDSNEIKKIDELNFKKTYCEYEQIFDAFCHLA
jgi:hypothetical protein